MSKNYWIGTRITKCDQDGDCGLVMKAGASNIIQEIQNKLNLNKDTSLLCDKIADSISHAMGGTSGIILEIFFRSMSISISKQV